MLFNATTAARRRTASATMKAIRLSEKKLSID